MRTLLWVGAGIVLGGIIHIAVILALPTLASEGLWPRIAALGALNKTVVLAVPATGECPCGRRTQLVKSIAGRVDDYLIASSGAMPPP